ncbi:putative DNA-binding protein HU [Desulfarculales bacterium]
MTKSEMIKDLSVQAKVTLAEAERVFDALVGNVIAAVRIDGRMSFTGLGVFKRAERKACQRNNPQRPGVKVSVPAHNTVTFKPCPDFYDKVNR